MQDMVLTLNAWAEQLREALANPEPQSGRSEAARLLAKVLADPDFLAALFAQEVGVRKVLYEDPDIGFCIVAHEFLGAKKGLPHDHSPSWAIYGQAAGETHMSDFELLPDGIADAPRKVRMTRSYCMKQGDVHLYNEGDIHAPSRTSTTRLLRIEGMNLANTQWSSFEVVRA
jgi:hypothetical protein